MKTYKEFLAYIEDNIMEYMPPDYAGRTAKIVHVTKNNDMVLDGLVICEDENGAYPTVYMEQFYSKLVSGANEQAIMEEIVSDYLDAERQLSHLSGFEFCDWEFVRGKTGYYIVNRELNKERLHGKVFTNVGEFAKVYMIIADVTACGFNFMLITQELLSEWGISKDELEETADNNMMAHFPPVLHAMEEQLKEMTSGKPAPNRLKRGIERDRPDIYVLTNRMKIHGAAVVLYPGLIEKVRNVIEDDFFIIPSSTEEVLIVPKKSGARKDQLEHILRDVNSKMETEEVLSDRIYEYAEGRCSMTEMLHLLQS